LRRRPGRWPWTWKPRPLRPPAPRRRCRAFPARISDTASQSLPVPFSAWFDAQAQRPRPVALLRHLMLHPAVIPRLSVWRGVFKAKKQIASICRSFPFVGGRSCSQNLLKRFFNRQSILNHNDVNNMARGRFTSQQRGSTADLVANKRRNQRKKPETVVE